VEAEGTTLTAPTMARPGRGQLLEEFERERASGLRDRNAGRPLGFCFGVGMTQSHPARTMRAKMKNEIAFDQGALVRSMREALEHARGKLTLKTAKVPRRPRAMSPRAIAQLRRKLKASTPIFAAYLNVTPDTVRSWEKNRRQPSGPALRLLQIAARRPEVLLT
jgi:putative transcriptional regulator